MVNYLPKGNKTLDAYGIQLPYLLREMKKMEVEIEKAVRIEDGKHTGEILAVDYRDEPFEYVDIIIREDDSDVQLKCGVPRKITEFTALGKILDNFGIDLKKIGKNIELDDIFKGRVEFVTVTEKTDKGNFARIQPTSLRPKK